MTIKSRFSLVGLVVPFTMIIMFICGGGGYVLWNRADFHRESHNYYVYITILCLIPVMLFVMIHGLTGYVNRIEIGDGFIRYTNVLTGKTVQYSFGELEGIVTQKMRSKGGDYDVLYLVRQGVYLGGISSIYYANYDELKDALKIPDLGVRPYSLGRNLRILGGKKVDGEK